MLVSVIRLPLKLVTASSVADFRDSLHPNVIIDRLCKDSTLLRPHLHHRIQPLNQHLVPPFSARNNSLALVSLRSQTLHSPQSYHESTFAKHVGHTYKHTYAIHTRPSFVVDNSYSIPHQILCAITLLLHAEPYLQMSGESEDTKDSHQGTLTCLYRYHTNIPSSTGSIYLCPHRNSNR